MWQLRLLIHKQLNYVHLLLNLLLPSSFNIIFPDDIIKAINHQIRMNSTECTGGVAAQVEVKEEAASEALKFGSVNDLIRIDKTYRGVERLASK